MSTCRGLSIEDVSSFLDERGARLLPHGPSRTLRDHLHGTMEILAHWHQPDEVVRAGLLHSVYATDAYRDQLIPFSERKVVTKVAGAAAERLAYFFGSIRRKAFFDSVGRLKPDCETMSIACHTGKSLTLSRHEAGDLLVIYMANAAEQTRASNGSPGLWLSAVSTWGCRARALAKRVPPVFHSCSRRISIDDERAARLCYISGLEILSTNRRAAFDQFVAAAERLPWVAEPRVLLAYTSMRERQWMGALQHGRAAQENLEHWGTSWDKRLPFRDWKSILSSIIMHSSACIAAPDQAGRWLHEFGYDSSADWMQMLKSLPSADKPQTASRPNTRPAPLPSRFVAYIAAIGRADVPSKHNFYPGLRRSPSYPPQHFALARALTNSYPAIHKEFRKLGRNDGFQEEIEKIRRTGTWRIFPLIELGKRNDENCGKCPVTASIIERHGAARSISSAAYFSILAPKTHVAAHRGPTNMRLRCHLGIDVPQACRLKVGDTVLNWRNGECLVFDDSYLHEVWNDSDKRRVVLVVDMWHPDLAPSEIQLLEGLQLYAYAHAGRMHRYWTKNVKARSDFGPKTKRTGTPCESRSTTTTTGTHART